MTETKLGLLTRDALARIAPESIAVVPLGATEQHGGGLPAATDTLIAAHLAESAVELVGARSNVVLCPALPFGVSEHHLPFGATISLDSETYIRALTSVGRTLARSGFRRVLLLNGHGGNVHASAVAADRLVSEMDLGLAVAVLSYWDCLDDHDKGSFGHPVPGHAGSFEASLVGAIDARLVDREAQTPANLVPNPLLVSDEMAGITRFPAMWKESDGVTDDLSGYDPVWGRAMLEALSSRIADFIVQFDTTARS